MKFRFRYEVAGGHTHVRLFAGEGQTLGLCGTLTFRNEEWELFKQLRNHAAEVQFKPEDQDAETPKS